MRNRGESEQDSVAGMGLAIGLAVAVAIGVMLYIGYLIVSGQVPGVVPHS